MKRAISGKTLLHQKSHSKKMLMLARHLIRHPEKKERMAVLKKGEKDQEESHLQKKKLIKLNICMRRMNVMIVVQH